MALRQSMAGLHTWVGVLAGWLLYAIFITGGISYFRQELTQWLRPEIPARPAMLDQAATAQRALAALSQTAPAAERWQIDLPGPRSNVIEAAWERGEADERVLLDPASAAVLTPRATAGGEFFYYLHFSLHYLPGTLGRWIVGLCAVMALVAMLSGLVVHRRIFRDFFTFRPGKGQRSWLDAHNISSVLALPFHLMIVYTGLVTLMFSYLPWGASAVFGPQARAQLAQVMQVRFDVPARRGLPAPLAPLAPLIAQAHAAWGADSVGRIVVTHPGDAAARIAIARSDGDRIAVAPAYLLFDGASGALLARHDSSGPALTTWSAAYALHLGRYADTTLRWLYLLCSMLGAATVATGMLLWTAKRPAGSPSFVERGNVACIAGLAAAVAAYLLANRLLPLGMAARAAWEIHSFFLCWAISAAHAAWRDPRCAWRVQWQAAACLWATLAAVDMIGAPRAFPVFDAVFLLVASLCLACGSRRRR